jgi:hypothetical protein
MYVKGGRGKAERKPGGKVEGRQRGGKREGRGREEGGKREGRGREEGRGVQ